MSIGILDENKNVKIVGSSEEDKRDWLKWFNEANRNVACTAIRKDGTIFEVEIVKVANEDRNPMSPPFLWNLKENDCYAVVSTVFLGINISNTGWFETIVKTGDEWSDYEHQNTWDEAMKLHNETVSSVISELK